jgi:hypothetical protein
MIVFFAFGSKNGEYVLIQDGIGPEGVFGIGVFYRATISCL